jgi:anti-sigma regulatory factor (Ser/Thr protein kinase)
VKITEVPRERFPAMIEATAYFVVSEALANVAKHARGGTAQVSIRRLPGGWLCRSATTGPAGPGRSAAPGWPGWRTG